MAQWLGVDKGGGGLHVLLLINCPCVMRQLSFLVL